MVSEEMVTVFRKETSKLLFRSEFNRRQLLFW